MTKLILFLKKQKAGRAVAAEGQQLTKVDRRDEMRLSNLRRSAFKSVTPSNGDGTRKGNKMS